MSSDKNTRKFPRGYDVTIVRKEDVLEAIDDNIIDKEIALDLIKQLELDASNFIKEGRWTSLPFIGTIRYNENKKAIIVPGFNNKLMVIATKFLPRSIIRKIIFSTNK